MTVDLIALCPWFNFFLIAAAGTHLVYASLLPFPTLSTAFHLDFYLLWNFDFEVAFILSSFWIKFWADSYALFFIYFLCFDIILLSLFYSCKCEDCKQLLFSGLKTFQIFQFYQIFLFSNLKLPVMHSPVSAYILECYNYHKYYYIYLAPILLTLRPDLN